MSPSFPHLQKEHAFKIKNSRIQTYKKQNYFLCRYRIDFQGVKGNNVNHYAERGLIIPRET